MNPYGIQLRQPLAGDIIGTKITIAAIGTAFEASYGWRLVNGDTTVAQGYFQAGSMGLLESFVHQADVSTDYSGPAALRVFGDDPSGESEGTDLVEIPVVVLAGITGYQAHQVVVGDTLTKLAEQYGATVVNIVLANGLSFASRSDPPSGRPPQPTAGQRRRHPEWALPHGEATGWFSGTDP